MKSGCNYCQRPAITAQLPKIKIREEFDWSLRRFLFNLCLSSMPPQKKKKSMAIFNKQTHLKRMHISQQLRLPAFDIDNSSQEIIFATQLCFIRNSIHCRFLNYFHESLLNVLISFTKVSLKYSEWRCIIFSKYS